MKYSIIITTLLFKVDARDYFGFAYISAMNMFYFGNIKKEKL